MPSLNWYKPLLRTRPYGGVRHCDGWAGTETSRCDAQRNSPRQIYYTPPLCCPHRWKGKKETWTNRASDCWCSSFHFVNGFTQPREWMQGRNRERRFLYFGRNDIVAFIPRAFLVALLYWLMYSAPFLVHQHHARVQYITERVQRPVPSAKRGACTRVRYLLVLCYWSFSTSILPLVPITFSIDIIIH